ncbi:cytochrome c oxidase subunit VB-domain-containing protein [Zopfochytrium polystomum]|nr:cytochrome c oxidase subunit VB-domain-containing protein [Zopfochytrium polystomum]
MSAFLRAANRSFLARPTALAGVSRRAFSAGFIARGAPAHHNEPAATEVPIPGYRKDGEVAKNWELATGNERYELIKNLEGVKNPYENFVPIYLTQKPTTKNPYILRGDDPEQYVGCTGFPAESHEQIWLTVRPHKGFDRCPHCGNVFKYIRNEGHH